MPEMDGLTATREMRKTHPDIPIIALTANVFQSEIQDCLNCGMNDFLPKPVKLEQLEEIINKWSQGESKEKEQAPVIDIPVVPAADNDLVDMQTLDSLKQLCSEGDLSFFTERITNFLDKAPEELKRIKEGYQNKDHDTLEEVCHRFKTSCGIVGAYKMMKCCAKMETLARDKQFDSIDQLIGELDKLHLLTRAQLDDEKRKAG